MIDWEVIRAIAVTTTCLIINTIIGGHAVAAANTLHNNLNEILTHKAQQLMCKSDFDTARLIAEDIKLHLHYNYNLESTEYAKHNFFITYVNKTYSIKQYLVNGTGICTDFCKVYATMLNAAGLRAETIERVKLANGAEHAYVIAYLGKQYYRIDITSYCTAEVHNANTSFDTYMEEYNMTEQQLTDMQFYGEALANVEQQIENCQKRINHDLMTQVIDSDGCGVPTESIELELELKALQQHRKDLADKLSQLAKETL